MSGERIGKLLEVCVAAGIQLGLDVQDLFVDDTQVSANERMGDGC